MSDQQHEEYGGDISSGFGESTLNGPVSDERAQRMLHEHAQEAEAAQGEKEHGDKPEKAGGGGGGAW